MNVLRILILLTCISLTTAATCEQQRHNADELSQKVSASVSASDILNQLDKYEPVSHPRVYANSERWSEIRQEYSVDPKNVLYVAILKEADVQLRLAKKSRSIRENKFRGVVDGLPFILVAYKITGHKNYRDGAIVIMERLSAMDDWFGNTDRRAARAIMSASLAYDWLFDNLSDIQKVKFRNMIIEHANIMNQALLNKSDAWTENYLSNHNYTNMMSLGIAGMALFGESDDARLWLKGAQSNYINVQSYLSEDGASAEGVSYWSGGLSSLLQYTISVKPVFGTSQILNHPHFRNSARYRLNMSLPGFAINADYADSKRFDYHGPQYILHALADLFNDGNAQWLAMKISSARNNNFKGDYWLDVFWRNPGIVPTEPKSSELYAWFDDLGIFTSRTSWNDDASWAFYKASPPHGNTAYRMGYSRGGHVHPDQGQFMYWSNDDWVVIDDGYVVNKQTSNHNVLLLDNRGQFGEGGKWFKGKGLSKQMTDVRIVYTELNEDYQYLETSLSGIYPELKNTQGDWIRSFIAFKDGMIVIRDEVTVSRPIDIESRVHFNETVSFDDKGFLCNKGKNIGTVFLDDNEKWDVGFNRESFPDSETKSGKGANYNLLTMSRKTNNHAGSIIILMPQKSKCGHNVASVSLDSNNTYIVNDGIKTRILDFARRNVSVIQ